MKKQEKEAYNYQIKLKAKMFTIQQKLATKTAFVNYYYTVLKNCKTQKEAFNITALMYYKLFKEDLFPSWDSFRKHKNKNY